MNESIEGDTSDEHLPDMETIQNHHQGAGIEGAQDQESAGEMEEGDEERSDKGEGGTKIFSKYMFAQLQLLSRRGQII